MKDVPRQARSEGTHGCFGCVTLGSQRAPLIVFGANCKLVEFSNGSDGSVCNGARLSIAESWSRLVCAADRDVDESAGVHMAGKRSRVDAKTFKKKRNACLKHISSTLFARREASASRAR